MSKSAFSFHFIQPQQIQDFFQQGGFEQVSITQPEQYFHNQNRSASSDEH